MSDTPSAADAASEPAVPSPAVSAPAPVDPGASLPPPTPQPVAPSAESEREWTAYPAADSPLAEADVAAAPLALRDDPSVVWHQGVGSPAEVSQAERGVLGLARAQLVLLGEGQLGNAFQAPDRLRRVKARRAELVSIEA